MKWRADEILFAVMCIGGVGAMIASGLYGLWTCVDIPIWVKTLASGGVFFFLSLLFSGV